MHHNKVSELISHIMTAISGRALYAEDHPVFIEFAEKALALLEELYVDGTMSIVMIGDGLIVNDTPFMERAVYVINFLRRLRKKKLEKIVFRKGLEIEEFKNFITAFSLKGEISSTPHISVGILEIRLKTTGKDVSELMGKGVSRVKEAYSGLSRLRKLDTVSLEEAVLDFISTLKKEMNVLRIVSPVKSHSEYTYIHATNVSVLTLFQAESLGLKGETLHDIGLAGLLHDVGKMFVPLEVLEKQGKLTAEEWLEMKKHPLHGAKYLSKIQDVPPLAPIVAFEHHIKFDGSGYPETKRIGRTQHIVSQMVTIADFFDALRTERPYRKALDVRTVAGLMKEGAGKDFNPQLVEIFLTSLARVSDGL
jgi:HD-GYP domain-containing protein (c-di-GMP phosphodiesterase class II)